MLSDTYTLGTGDDVYSKRYADNGKSQYGVGGLAPNAARELVVSHETLSNGRVRSMISLNNTDVNPDSPSGATGSTRVYLVIDRQPFIEAADITDCLQKHYELIADATFYAKVLNKEV